MPPSVLELLVLALPPAGIIFLILWSLPTSMCPDPKAILGIPAMIFLFGWFQLHGRTGHLWHRSHQTLIDYDFKGGALLVGWAAGAVLAMAVIALRKRRHRDMDNGQTH